jgi:hypothetical protein
VKAVPPWITYTVLRLLLFAVPLAIMLAFSVYWVIAVVAAAIIGLVLSYILLRKSRNAVALDLHEIRNKPRPVAAAYDDDIEDAEIDAASAKRTRTDGSTPS